MKAVRPDALALTSDFTEARYRALVETARDRFRFRRLTDNLDEDAIALWRHDIDFSPNRALALAKIESEFGVPAAYFVLIGSPFYNPFETATRDVLREIAALGHDIGLHYDASLIEGDLLQHEDQMSFEAATLARWLGVPVRSFSLHNPTVSADVAIEGASHAGLINASAAGLREKFHYCSDSNGIWRYRSLQDVIGDPAIRRLYALTHAEWWTPEPMPRSQRVQRCIDGRARRVAADYRAFLQQHRPDALVDE
jgi:hypothetical protein